MEKQRAKRIWLGDSRSSVANSGAVPDNDPRENLRRTALILLLVLVLMGPIMTFGGLNLSDQGAVERQIGYLVILGLTVYAVLPVANRASWLVAPVPILIAFAWCWLSLAWSIDPASTLRRITLTTTVGLTIFLLVRHSNFRSMTDMIRWCLLGAIIVSYLVVFIDPPTGVHLMTDSAMPTVLIGNWRGFLGHKNFAGAVCALCILVFVFDSKHIAKWVRASAIILTAYFLYRTQSKTSAGMLLMAIAGGVMFEMLSRRLRAFLIPILTIIGSAIWFFTSAYADYLKTNFFDPTAFTGRGQIWSVLLRYAADHLWLGTGFGAFWNIGPQSPVYTYGQGYVTEISVGHSGYIDQLAAVGLPGVLLMVFAAMVWPLWKLLSRTDIAPERGALIASLLLFCIGHNITETGLFERDAIVSSFLFLTVALAQYSGARDRVRASSTGSGDALLKMMRDRHKQRERAA